MKIQDIGICFLLAISLPSCAKLGRTARISPTSVAMPNFGNRDPNCPLIAGYAGEQRQAIDLSCFRFPDDSNPARTATATATGTDSATAELNQTDSAHAMATSQPGRQAPAAVNVTVSVSTTERPTAYQLAVQKPSAQGATDERAIYRTRLQEILVDQSNRVCLDAKGRIYANKAFSNSVLEAVSSGLSISSSIVGGDLAKSILSGGAGFATGLRSNVDANVYQNQLVSAITKVMALVNGGRTPSNDSASASARMAASSASRHSPRGVRVSCSPSRRASMYMTQCWRIRSGQRLVRAVAHR